MPSMVAQAHPFHTLTPKQEAFARFIAGGKSQVEAYRLAYDSSKMAHNSCKTEAFKLITTPAIAAKIRELQERADANQVLTRTRKRHLLFEIAEAKRNKPMERIAAMAEDSKMCGDYQPVKVEGDLTLNLVLTSVKQVKPITELVQEPETMTLQEEPSGMATPDESVRPTAVPPALPFDSGPFADQVAVLPPTAEQTPVKLTRTRSYDE